ALGPHIVSRRRAGGPRSSGPSGPGLTPLRGRRTQPRVAARLLVAMGIACALATAGRASEGLKPGDTLGPDSWQKAEKLLPPEILAHYKTGEYVNPINDWPE